MEAEFRPNDSCARRASAAASSACVSVVQSAARDAAPRAPELFMSDVHGEFVAFDHILRNGCGTIRTTIDAVFGDGLSADDKNALAAAIYYPRERRAYDRLHGTADDAATRTLLVRMGQIARAFASGRTEADIDAAAPDGYADAIREVLVAAQADAAATAADGATDGEPGATPAENGARASLRLARIADAVIAEGCADDLCAAVAATIQHLAVAHLHLLGDVYDRGPAPDRIMDLLESRSDVDLVWGNHDIVWMGAALGQPGCIAHVVRNCARYANLDILTEAYGIDILPLAMFARDTYGDDPCEAFELKGGRAAYPGLAPWEYDLCVRIQKAMTIIQLKVEGQLIDRYPSFGLGDRKLLGRIDYEAGTISVDGVTYEMRDLNLPTVDRARPYELTADEQSVLDRLVASFTGCARLRAHMDWLLERGRLYRIVDDTLLLHACVPLNDDGTLKDVDVFGRTVRGKALFDATEQLVRDAFSATDERERERGRDFLWYVWLGQGSPLFAKSKMATFEIYFIADKAARKEQKNAFYRLLDDEATLRRIFEDFGMDPARARIVCGHVPVKVKSGEDPVHAGGRALIIDGGFSRAYRSTTGIAGLALLSNAQGLQLATLTPLDCADDAIAGTCDIVPSLRPIA